MANIINWFEVPVSDMDRAIKFYSKVFGYETMNKINFGGFNMAFFPMEESGVGGALCKGDWYIPSKEGALIYFNGGEDLSTPLSKVLDAGGSIIMPKKQISEEYGFMALIIDSEGNRVALHSQK